MESSIVIKVKYEDTLRRFNARIVNDELDLSMDGLREKIVSMFKFAPDAQLNFTYIDEDNDVVALVDDEELRDVVRQALNPLRITVNTSTAKSPNSPAHSSRCSTDSLSTPLQEKVQTLNTNVSEIIKSLPEPLRGPLSKLSSDLAKKVSTYSASNLAEITDSFSKLGLHYLNQLSESPSSGESKKPVEAYKESDGLKNVPTELTNGASCGKPTPRTKRVMRKSNSPFKNDRVIPQGAYLAPGLNSSLTPSGSGHTNTGQPAHAIVPGADAASKGKQELKETGEIAGVRYFGASPVSNNGSSSGMDSSRGWWRQSDASWTTSVEGGRKNKPSFDLHYPLNECPFTGLPIKDTTIPHDAASEMPERIYNNSSGIFHRGIRCDGCGVHPITGPRFKSTVREDYDLCSICFAEMGNDADFMRIDQPVVYRHPRSLNGSYMNHRQVYPPTLPQKLKCDRAESTPLQLDSRFVLDVNILDGTIMSPLTHFTKIWRMKNNGTTVWPQGTRLVWTGGVRMTISPYIELEIAAAGVQVDQELDVAVDFVAPHLHGRHISYWRMALPTGQKFGQRVWVLIEVDASMKKPMHAAKPGFNLNLPPASEVITAPETGVPIPEPMMNQNLPEPNMPNASVTVETVDVPTPAMTVDQSLPEPKMSNTSVETVDVPIPEATVVQSLPEPNMSNASVETNEPVGNGQVSKEQEAKFPIDDSLLVGGTKYNDSHSGQSSSVSYPIIDLSDEIEPPVSAPSGMAILASDDVGVDSLTEEEKLLKELDDMGFKHVALNKEILKMNKYDLEQTIDDLCGGSEWDPILEELEEMGFYDRVTNKRLLRKNDGSIKRVVMDLIAEETE